MIIRVQEEQAELRHAAFQPALLAAVDAVRVWLAEDGGAGSFASRLAAASTTGASSCRSDGGAVQPLPRSRAPTGSSQPGSSEQADARCDPPAAQQVDYIALAAVKGTVHPKLCFTGGSTAGVTP